MLKPQLRQFLKFQILKFQCGEEAVHLLLEDQGFFLGKEYKFLSSGYHESRSNESFKANGLLSRGNILYFCLV